jgi:predicted alpha/beta superfamily hydrolase
VPFVEARWPVGSRRVLYGESYRGLLVLAAALVGDAKVGRQP